VRVTVCQLRTAPGALEQDWDGLVAHVAAERSELVVLPEMGFAPWFATDPPAGDDAWPSAVAAHEAWTRRLPELGAAVVGTRPVTRGADRRNSAYVGSPDGTVRGLHDKSYLPDEDGFWEASWYGRGDGGHAVVDAGGLQLGVLGLHRAVVPRARPRLRASRSARGRDAPRDAGRHARQVARRRPRLRRRRRRVVAVLELRGARARRARLGDRPRGDGRRDHVARAAVGHRGRRPGRGRRRQGDLPPLRARAADA
jgi:hypothetical protein